MKGVTRRQFLRSSSVGLGVGLAGGLAGCAASMKGDFAPKSGRRVIVIGGGWGGATAARYVRLADPSIEVILIEPNKEFVSCPFSNLVLSGQRTIESLTISYEGLRNRGVKIIHETATAIEPDTKRVRIGQGYLAYGKLVVSPGVD
ncbi:MAG TPA: FAD/NAD(P)-binding oxidoreductase, partial [Methylomirabilota bacterium]|nr:FAD/NAD(P)-binding oxidoreductase [Methylomirabilota bacterium]